MVDDDAELLKLAARLRALVLIPRSGASAASKHGEEGSPAKYRVASMSERENGCEGDVLLVEEI